MKLLIIAVLAVLALQTALFFAIRARKKKEKENSVIEKYKIKSAGDAFRLMNNPEIDENDRAKIQRLYSGEEE